MLEPSQSQRYHSRWRDLDPFMPITTLVLFGFGLLAIYSANNRRFDINALAARQLIYAGVGVALMITFTVIDYRQLRSLAVPIYLGAVALIAL